MYQMPGVFSRPPFGDSVTWVSKLLEPVNRELNAEYGDDIARLRGKVGEFYENKNPFIDDIGLLRSSYDRIVLVPLQVDGYFMVDALENNFSTQFEFLVYVLKNTPSGTAVVATQYKGRNGLGSVLSEIQIRYLKDLYPNFIYLTKADQIPYCSQYLVPIVDGVVGLSSSIIAHGALWQKPVLAFGRSHVSEFASKDTFEGFFGEVDKRQPVNRDKELQSFLAASQIPVNDILEDPTTVLGLEGGFILRPERHYEQLDFDAAVASQPFPVNETYKDIILNASKGCSVVSFDIFDTLLVRTHAQPSDVFEIVGGRYASELGVTVSLFSALRRDAERRAFQKAVDAGRGEITLKEIYADLADFLGREAGALEQVAQYEIEVEQNCLTRRESVCAAFDRLKAEGRRIILVSDMYLPPEVLTAVLKKNEITGYSKLYVSCDVGVKKHSGKLFDHVLDELQISSDQMLHVGDNEHGDIKMAQARGINTVHVKRPWEAFEQSALYQEVWSPTSSRHEMDLKRVLSVMAKDQFAEANQLSSWFHGDSKKLGYFGMGPLLFDYTNWLIRSSIDNGVKKLFFLARDGKIMKEAYDRLSAQVPGAPSSEYLLCSRRAVNVANLKDRNAIERLLEIEYTKGTLAEYVEHRFGIPAHKLPSDKLAKYGVAQDTSIGTHSKFDIKPFIREISDIILDNAAKERALYKEYLREVGFSGDGIAVVDIGYAGTMQESLCVLAGLERLDGYYVITFRSALERMRRAPLTFNGYLGNFIDRHDTTQLWARHVPLYETMFSTEETSFVRFMMLDNKRVPVYMAAGRGDEVRVNVVTGIRRGALRFIDSMVAAFGTQASTMDIGNEKALKTLAKFFANPKKEDAKILLGVAFEDAYGGGRGTILLAQQQVPGEVWHAGRSALDAGDRDRALKRKSSTAEEATITGGVMLNASHLQTVIGERSRTAYRVPVGAEDGMLCYGPYRTFAAGRWMAVFVLHSDVKLEASLFLEVVKGQSEIISRQKLKSRVIDGTQSFYLDFEITDVNKTIEFRVWVKDARTVSGLKLLSVSAYPCPVKLSTDKERKRLF